MRVALVNPPWTFDGSIYFGCRDSHLPLELGYARALLEASGHEPRIFDAQAESCSPARLRERIADFAPGMTVLTTAPSYLFWRCAPPELRVPQETAVALDGVRGDLVIVGPHASTTPRVTLRKLDADAVVMGECEETLVALATTPREGWSRVPSIAWSDGDEIRVQGGRAAADMSELPPLAWSDDVVARHGHHHHRFDRTPDRPGAEVETSRGCPYACTFCAKDNFRSAYRRRPLATVLAEVDGLIAQGVEYVYFIDEIFLPQRDLLEALCERPLAFGVQMRVDNWDEDTLDLLAKAGCVSVEAGVESITVEGRSLLAKKCKASTERIAELLVHAKRRIPFVQANLIEAKTDRADDVAAWRAMLQRHGVWSNEPVPMFPYPGSPDYTLRWGPPDDVAWERAHAHYLSQFAAFSDIQESRPLPLAELELPRARA